MPKQGNSPMDPVDFKHPFTDTAFDDAFDLDVWNDEDTLHAFNPFGQAAKAFSIAENAKTAKEISTTERLPSQNHRQNPKVHSRRGDRRGEGKLQELSVKPRSSPPNPSHDEEQAQESPRHAGSNELSTSARSSKSNYSSESKDDAGIRGKNLDRRARTPRLPMTATKQPVQRRSLPGKNASLRNLVVLLNSSTDSFGDDLQDTVTSATTIDSKSTTSHQHDDKGPEEYENGKTAPQSTVERAKTQTQSVQEVTRMKSRQRPNADLADELKQAASGDVEQPTSSMPNRGVRKSHSLRSRQIIRGDVTDSKASNQDVEQPASTIPTRGIRRARSQRVLKADPAVDPKAANSADVEHSNKIPTRGVQKAHSLRVRRSLAAGVADENKPGASRHNQDTPNTLEPVTPRGFERAHITKSRQSIRSNAMDEINNTEAKIDAAPTHDILRSESVRRRAPDKSLSSSSRAPPRTLSGRSRACRRAKSTESIGDMACALASNPVGLSTTSSGGGVPPLPPPAGQNR